MVSFANLKERLSLEDGAKLLDLKLTEKDGQLRGPCPACNAGGARALVITPSKGAFCWHAKKGGDVIWLCAHVKGMQLKEAAEYLAGNPTTKPPLPAGSFTPLDHLHHKHERVQAIIAEETAIALGVGYASKGVLRGCVAVPLHDQAGVLLGYVGIEESGLYRFPPTVPQYMHLFNAHQVLGREVQIVPTVEDALAAQEQGIVDVVCFLTPTARADQLNFLARWLEEHDRVAVF